MIKLELTVREAMNLLATSWAYNNDAELYHKIVTAFEVALGENQRRRVTITGGMNLDNRIACIKSIREHTGWGLKESKDWTDVIVGINGGKNTVLLKTPQAAEQLLRDLAGLGCEGYLS
jgi:ribosomal protein L7/L12